MKPFSLDLRRRLVSTYEDEPGSSYPRVAKQFHVSESTVRRYVKQWRETGELFPQEASHGRHPVIEAADLPRLSELVKANVDATQDELRQRLAEKTGVAVSQPTLCRALQRAQITRKKRRGGRLIFSARTCRRLVATSSSASSIFGQKMSLPSMKWDV